MFKYPQVKLKDQLFSLKIWTLACYQYL